MKLNLKDFERYEAPKEYIGCRIDEETKRKLLEYIERRGIKSVSALLQTLVKQIVKGDKV